MQKFLRESWLVLVMGASFALLLGGTQLLTGAQIQENKRAALNEAFQAVVPVMQKSDAAAVVPPAPALDVVGIPGGVGAREVYVCYDAETDATLGFAVDASGGGFVDNIRLVVGLSPDLSQISGIRVIEQIETPGLGNKIETDPDWYGQYTGMDAGVAIETLKAGADNEQNQINAITGATWSSRYVSDIVNDVLAKVRPELERLSANGQLERGALRARVEAAEKE